MSDAKPLWRRAAIPPGASLQQAIRALDEIAIKIVLVVEEDGKLVGTISDGDIRRGLLRGLDLNSPVKTVVHHNPLVVPPGVGRDLIVQFMLANKVQQIPEVDEDNRLVGLHLWEHLTVPQAKSNLMVIMAGGLGTRLRPHTETCPKPMLPVAGKPMLQHIVEQARSEGFTRFVFAIHYLGHVVEEYFADGARLDVQIDYMKEESPLGTAGALSLLMPRPEAPFVVTNGDVITDIRYGELLEFHHRHEATATMAVRVHEWQHPFGVVQMDGVDIVGFEEKPISRSHINAGVYVLDPSALNEIEMGERCDMPTLFERLQFKQCRTVAYPMHEPWLDVGRPSDLEKARNAANSDADVPKSVKSND